MTHIMSRSSPTVTKYPPQPNPEILINDGRRKVVHDLVNLTAFHRAADAGDAMIKYLSC
ncbi:hypothetical protein [Embleya sp. NPDC005971]|uniref:hypothetical protein n=1 Tax=Embleya sp. NPDC005971 TaxID=3156724 RepID=UPI0033CA801C